MIVIVGFIVVIGSVLGGFTMAGGEIGALIHPSEIVTIGGAAFGGMLVSSSPKVVIDLFKMILASMGGNPFSKAAYRDLMMCMYDLLKTARREGLLALESHISHPHDSAIFQKYPLVAKNHHLSEFISGALSTVIDGSASPQQLSAMLDKELKVMEDEHHIPLIVLTKTADALPGFGIVAAVLGIVITMGAISGPVEEIGHKVGAALVGTFLGILMSYGFLAPLAAQLELRGMAEFAFFRTTAAIILAFVDNVPPRVAIEQARRGLTSDVRPNREELDKMLAEVDAAGK
ncbi:MAG: flagellar motor stator protein MotA [Pirellulales bacterium]|nr:flagellar motor stator protein MotA [Pirellulales bacterium]